MTATADATLAHAVPLEHPPDFSVRTRNGSTRLYTGGCLDIEGESFAVHHETEPNLAAREALLQECEDDEELRQAWLWAVSRPCVSSYLLWLNWFCWTYASQSIDPAGHQRGISGDACDIPFITWPCQDRAAAELFEAITTGYDCTLDKSRQMGATWLISSLFVWFTLYQPNSNFEILSRTEEQVDLPGDPKSCFWKMDFLIAGLPPWLKPRLTRHRLRLINEDRNSTIMGRSTTSGQGRGGALNAVLIDEASQIDELEAIWTSFGQSTSCRIANSTPFGVGFFSKLVRNRGIRRISLPWFEHPEKGRGRHTETDPGNGETFIASPFYTEQCKRCSPDPANWFLGRKTREIAQELDMDHSGSGSLVFDYSVISRQLAMCPAHPNLRGELRITCDKLLKAHHVRAGALEHFDFEEHDRGKFELWTDLEEDEQGFLRPPQNKTYILGADIAQGVGASESVLSVYCPEERRKVGQYRDANISPVQFALLSCAAGWWFGGARRYAMIAFERNGYGESYGKALVKLRYPWILHDSEDSGRSPRPGPRLGWFSTRAKKIREFDALRAAMAGGEYNDPSREALEQKLEIVHYEGGSIGPAAMEHLSEQARTLHGDIVTADALSHYGSTKTALSRPAEADPPAGSALWRRKHQATIIASAPNRRADRQHPQRPNPFTARAKRLH